MSRTTTWLALALTLVTGVLLGVLIDRGGPRVSAQAAAPSTAQAQTPAPGPRPATDDAAYEQLAKQYAQFEPVNRTFEMVAKAVSPAVVHIVAQKSGRIDETARVRQFEETGSGVIVRADKAKGLFVLTNNHVVEGATAGKINIFLQDGRSIRPDRVWLDPKADIAVLNLNRDDLASARFGNSDEAPVGSWVLALGSPFGLTHSVSQGIISARSRHMEELPDVENQDFLQTDAAINPGNSGGPLVNMKGELIGINNSIASNGGGNEGVGFSIPSNLARWIMNQLITSGRVSRGALGIDLHPEFRVEDAQNLGLDHPKGAWVDVVHAGSPASAAGLEGGDVILKFQGVDVHDLNHLINIVSMAAIGQQVDLVVWRAKRIVNLQVKVGERDRALAQAGPSPRSPGGLLRRPDRPAAPTVGLGLELQALDESTARRLGLPSALRGAIVMRVASDSPFAGQIHALDVIHAVNGRPIKTAEEAARALVAHAGAEPLLVSIDRLVQGKLESRTVRLP